MDEATNSPDIKKQDSTKKIKKQDFLIRPLRTYEEDVANFVKKEKVSTSTIVAAEQKRRREGISGMQSELPSNEKGNRNQLLIKISAIIIIAGVIISAGAFAVTKLWTVASEQIVRMDDFRDVLIDKKENIRISIDNKVPIEIKNEFIRNIKNPPALLSGEIAEFQIIRSRTFNEENRIIDGMEKISPSEFLSYIELRPPEMLIRSLDQNYLAGMIGTREGSAPFLLFKITDFERVYAGMFEWESNSLYRDINDIFFETLGTDDFLVVTGDIAESNDPISFNPNKLIDIIISNRDTRAIVNNRGDLLFFYTFVNNDYLLLTSKAQVVQDITRKINLQNVVR